MLRAIFRIIMLAMLLLVYTVVGGLLLFACGTSRRHRAIAPHLVGFFSRIGLKILGIRCQWLGVRNRTDIGSAKFVVANHLSYVDVLCLAARMPLAFVTSVEIRDTFPLGLWCRIGGCFFVERRSRSQIPDEVIAMCSILRQGIGVAVFPEATSTNGERVLPFKNSMFAAAIASGTPVLPIVLRYQTVNDAPIDQVTRDSVYWYGTMGFASHLWRLANLSSVTLEISVLDEVPIRSDQSRKQLAEYSQLKISQCYLSRLSFLPTFETVKMPLSG